MQKQNNIIFLCGFMTSGKSSVLNVFKSNYKLKCIDLDRSIEKKSGKKITAIFDDLGEKKFRKLEALELKKVIQKKPDVVALGGGSLLNQNNLRLIKKSGSLVWLKIKPNTVIKRLSKKEIQSRPLLKKLNMQSRFKIISRLMKLREVNYKQAKVTVNADNKSAKQCAKIIYEKYKNKFKKQ